MKTIDEVYKTSDDYEMLYKICSGGFEVICIVNYNFRFPDNDVRICRDITVVKNNLHISARGIGYNDVCGDTEEERKKHFIAGCKVLNVKFIIPDNIVFKGEIINV